MIKFFTRQLHDTVDDELGQRWCLGCGEFVFECQCGYITLWRKLMLRLRRPWFLDVDPEYGPSPVYFDRDDEPHCTYCTQYWGCGCPLPERFHGEYSHGYDGNYGYDDRADWTEEDFREWYLDHFDGRDVMTEDELRHYV